MILKLIQTELKRSYRLIIPFMVEMAVILALLAAALFVFLGTGGSSSAISRQTVAISAPTDDKFLWSIINSVEETQSIKSMFDFIHTDEESVRKDVKDGKAVGVIIPEGFVKSIMYGENLPAKILFKSYTSTGYAMTRLIFECGGKMLGNSQAGVYSFIDEYYRAYGESIPSDELIGINIEYLSFVMGRAEFFTEEKISASDGLSSLQYFLCSSCLAFMMLMGISCSYLFGEDSAGFWQKLRIYGINPIHRTVFKLFSVCAVIILSAAIFLFFGSLADSYFKTDILDINLTGILGIALSAILASAFSVFVFHAAKSRTAGSLIIFAASFSMIFISGGFVPSYFLPPVFAKISALLPTYPMSSAVGAMFTQALSVQTLTLLFFWFIVFISGSVLSLMLRGE